MPINLDMTDPKIVAACIAIGVLLVGMIVQLVFLAGTFLKSDAPTLRKSTRARKPSSKAEDAAAVKKSPRTPKAKAPAAAADIVSPTRRSARISKTPAQK